MSDTLLRPRRPTRAPADEARRATRRARVTIGVVAAVVVAVIAGVFVLGLGGSGGQPLGPTSTQADGAKALVSVLREQGVRVVTTDSLAATRKAAAADPEGTTVFAYDSGQYLPAASWKALAPLSAHTVVVDPGQAALDAIAPGVSAGPELDGTLSPRCDLPALAEISQVTGSGTGYTVTSGASETLGATTCLPLSGGKAFGLVQVGSVTILGASAALTNQSIVDDDNAALALTLLGDSSTLVWYQPSLADLPKGSGTLASLTPGWVTPGIALLAVAAIAAGVWRGRRFGPLVVERLPVVVRSTETTEGRARLYERSSARVHALDQIRIGTIGRLQKLTGLSRSSTVDDVVFRVAGLIGANPADVRATLVDTVPRDDKHLVSLSDALRDLESATARAVATR